MITFPVAEKGGEAELLVCGKERKKERVSDSPGLMTLCKSEVRDNKVNR